jgi:hypothetical protein
MAVLVVEATKCIGPRQQPFCRCILKQQAQALVPELCGVQLLLPSVGEGIVGRLTVFPEEGTGQLPLISPLKENRCI